MSLNSLTSFVGSVCAHLCSIKLISRVQDPQCKELNQEVVYYGSKYHIWIPIIFTCYFDQEIIKSLEFPCLGNPNSFGYLV